MTVLAALLIARNRPGDTASGSPAPAQRTSNWLRLWCTTCACMRFFLLCARWFPPHWQAGRARCVHGSLNSARARRRYDAYASCIMRASVFLFMHRCVSGVKRVSVQCRHDLRPCTCVAQSCRCEAPCAGVNRRPTHCESLVVVNPRARGLQGLAWPGESLADLSPGTCVHMWLCEISNEQQ